ncbi:MAG: class I SAM-dependent methyltransferase [Chloroflexi bacterium]|nr:class I SAM-dependent methyltransferase [Chloroflexota bacterium]
MQNWISRTFWSTYHDSSAVRRELADLMGELDDGQPSLNVGSGGSDLHTRVVNLDRKASEVTDCVGDALKLPFGNGSFRLVLSQETMEHVADPFQAVREMQRVLGANGILYLQVPFVLGYHPDPEDYWRFTHSGLRRLIEQAGLQCERIEPALAAGTGVHRILVEFLAGVAARLAPRTYRPVKGALAILFYPLKWMDGWLSAGAQRDRIPGGYFGIGRKTA